MSQTYDALNDKLIEFIRAQKMFFVATAPLSAEGSVNLSPKGYDSFLVIDASTVAYLDLGGSGIETHAHVRENGRITFMFCAFDGAANIVRIYGRAEAFSFDDPEYRELRPLFAMPQPARGIIRCRITRVTDACGWGVPFYDYRGERDQLTRYIDHKPEGEWLESRLVRNAQTIDGLPGLVRGSRRAVGPPHHDEPL